MKLAFQSSAKNPQRGVTLIELLISITIGLTIMIAIGVAYMNSSNLRKQRENQSDLNEPAALVMRMLKQDLTLAGYVDFFDVNANADAKYQNAPQAATLVDANVDDLTNIYLRVPTAAKLATPLTLLFPGLMPVFGCDGVMNGTPNAIGITAATANVTCGAASATQQSLQIAYQAVPSAVIPTGIAATVAAPSLQPANVNTGEGRDCNQQALLAPQAAGAALAREAKFAINRYYIRPNASDGVYELYCAGSGNSIPQPIARGVEEFVLRYQTALPGVAGATAAAGSAQSQYASATTVQASAIGWANVTAVEICIVSATSVLNGPAALGTTTLQPNRPTCARRTVAGLGADQPVGSFADDIVKNAGDARLWKRFTQVKTIRNAIFSTPY